MRCRDDKLEGVEEGMVEGLEGDMEGDLVGPGDGATTRGGSALDSIRRRTSPSRMDVE